MARHIVCVLDRTVGHVSICWDYVSIFINKNSNYNKINQICIRKLPKIIKLFLSSLPLPYLFNGNTRVWVIKNHLNILTFVLCQFEVCAIIWRQGVCRRCSSNHAGAIYLLPVQDPPYLISTGNYKVNWQNYKWGQAPNPP